jgi:hypothetical protein
MKRSTYLLLVMIVTAAPLAALSADRTTHLALLSFAGPTLRPPATYLDLAGQTGGLYRRMQCVWSGGHSVDRRPASRCSLKPSTADRIRLLDFPREPRGHLCGAGSNPLSLLSQVV